MNKKVVFLLIVLTVLLYAWPPGQWFHTGGTTVTHFAEVPSSSSSIHGGGEPFKEEEFINEPGNMQVHAASIAELKDNTLAAVWYSGQYEGAPDTRIYFTTRASTPGASWTPPAGIVDRASASQELNRYIKKIGNPLVFTDQDDRLVLLFVSVSVGGWSGSSLNMKVSSDKGKTWSRSQRLTLSPFFNVSELVRNNPLRLTNGGVMVPIYHEFIGIFSELLWLRPGDGEHAPVYFKTRMTWGTQYLQPDIVGLTPNSAAAFFRGSRSKSRVALSLSDDAGETWTTPQYFDLPNPGSGLNALLLSDGRILLAFNDSSSDRHNLTLAISNKGYKGLTEHTEYTERQGKKFQIWQRAAVLENTPGEEFSYPYMLRTSDGKIHLVYTWQRKRIKHIVFNEEWIEKNLSDE
ncbi:MAG: Sialidase protein [Acidobacteriota bacterium]|nr:Sialidase protein [Acidobacteriota bacterium]